MSNKNVPSSLNPIFNHLKSTASGSMPATPRSHRSRGGTADISRLRPVIAVDMDRELVECRVGTFIDAYLPFVPSGEVIERIVRELSDSSYQVTSEEEPTDEESSHTESSDEESSESSSDEESSPSSSESSSDAESSDTESSNEEASDVEVAREEVAKKQAAKEKAAKAKETREKEAKEEAQFMALIVGGDSLMLHDGSRMIFRNIHAPPVPGFGSEKVAYSPLVSIAEAISEIQNLFPKSNDVPERKFNGLKLHDVSTRMIGSKIEGSNNKIDACFMQGEAEDVDTSNIAVVIEYKLSLSEEAKHRNSLQAVSANVQIMNDDVRRMWTYGITIESDQVTLWHHSRSHSAMSTRFSFVDNPKLLIKVFTSFLFASRLELGYDPRVEREEAGSFIFDIPVVENSQVTSSVTRYRTVKSISEYRSNNISGRMVRVNSVQKYDSVSGKWGEDKYVLKDVWLDENASTERQLQEEIFGDIREFWAKSDEDVHSGLLSFKQDHAPLVSRGDHKRFFLHIEDDYVGQLSKKIPHDFWPVRGRLLPPEVKDRVLDDQEGEGSSPATSNVGSYTRSNTAHTIPAPMTRARQEFVRTYARKKQYRVVFKEECVTVGKLSTLGEVMDVIEQTLTALQLLLCAGWVHRDISSGNILAYRENLDESNPWQAKLSDLEYARKFPPPPGYQPSADPKTGTPYFMPYEIMTRKPLYSREGESAKVAPILTAAEYLQKIRKDKQAVAAGASNTQEASFTVVHNFQHDLESIWWLILWNITSRVQHSPSQEYAEAIFQHTDFMSQSREHAFTKDIYDTLQPIILPSLFDFLSSVEAVRSYMYTTYIQRGLQDTVHVAGAYGDVHRFFSDILRELRQKDSTWYQTPLKGGSAKTWIPPNKRRHSGIGDDKAGQDESAPKSKLSKTTHSTRKSKSKHSKTKISKSKHSKSKTSRSHTDKQHN